MKSFLESLVSDATRRSYKRELAKFEEYYGKSFKFLLKAHALFCLRLSFHLSNLPIWRTEGVCSVLEVWKVVLSWKVLESSLETKDTKKRQPKKGVRLGYGKLNVTILLFNR